MSGIKTRLRIFSQSRARSHYARDLFGYGQDGGQLEKKTRMETEVKEEGKATGHAVNDYRDYPRCWLTATNASVQARRGARARDAGCRTGLRYYQADAVAR